ncbi:hypothetical protein E2C01_065163 [Portunus trituberculatus]|uniref:Uncharacterized protein n=1 Tax=Portunus trituberculatus TaxID=210409 RepID=A0A5B7HDS4_PORTR|nr:hypothetical protein [Portunus trituberculatus]
MEVQAGTQRGEGNKRVLTVLLFAQSLQYVLKGLTFPYIRHPHPRALPSIKALLERSRSGEGNRKQADRLPTTLKRWRLFASKGDGESFELSECRMECKQ